MMIDAGAGREIEMTDENGAAEIVVIENEVAEMMAKEILNAIKAATTRMGTEGVLMSETVVERMRAEARETVRSGS